MAVSRGVPQRSPRGVSVCLLALCLSAGAAVGGEDAPRPLDPDLAASQVVAAVRAGDEAGLLALAARVEPDPWLVVDALAALGEGDAARRFAGALKAPGTQGLAAYLLRSADVLRAERERAAFQATEAARAKDDWAGVLDAAAAVVEPQENVPGVRLELSRGLALEALGRHADAATSLERAADAAERLGWLRASLIAHEKAGWSAWAAGDRERALAAWEAQLGAADALGDAAASAFALGNLGQVHAQLGQLSEARARLERALGLMRETGDRLGTARVLLGLGGVLVRLGAYADALALQEEALGILRDLGDRWGVAAALSNIGHVLERLGRYRQALERQEQALAAMEDLQDEASVARVLQNVGVLRLRLSEYDEALAVQQRALALFRKVQDVAGEARALNDLAVVFQAMGDFPRALETLREALELKRRLGDEVGAATTLGNIGVVELQYGDGLRALETETQVLERFRALEDKAGQSRALANLGEVHRLLGDYDKALRCKQQALELLTELQDAAGAAHTWAAVGVLYVEMGRYADGLALLEESRTTLEALGDRAGAALVLGTIGSLYADLGEDERALSMLEAARGLQAALKDVQGEARTLVNIGYTEERLGHLERAIASLERAESLSEEVGDRVGVATAVQVRARVLQRGGRTDEALATATRALALCEALGSRADVVRALATLGLVHVQRGAAGEALAHLERAVREATRLRGAPLLVQTLTALARLRLEQGDAGRALAEVQRATTFVGDLLAGLSDEEGTTARAEFAEPYAVGALAALRLDDAHEAFAFLEGGRAGALVYALDRRQVLRGRSVPEALRAEEAAARAEEAKARHAHDLALRTRELPTIQAATRTLDAARERMRDVRARIQRDAGRQAASYVTRDLYPTAATLEEVQARLPAGTALVLYGLCLDEALAVVLTREDAHVRALGRAREVTDLCASLEGDPRSKAYREALEGLGARVVKPLGLPDGVRRVLLSPDGPLCYVPFAALLPDVAVAFVPSGTTFIALADQDEGRGQGVLALGDPAYEGAPKGAVGLLRSGPALEALPASRAEATAVGDVTLLAGEATPRGFREQVGKRSRWRAVHLACHGLIDRERPRFSSLALSPTGDDDGLLTCNDVLDMEIRADLVVLSACRTARGRVFAGEGIVGFTRAFMYAGSPRVICSLWKVEDEATKALMVRFYELWNPGDGRPGVPAAEALREAQAFVRADPRWRDPFYWAAWVLWGLPD